LPSSLFFSPSLSKKGVVPEKKNQKYIAILKDAPPLPSPNAPSAEVTNIKVAIALLAPPSPASPTLYRRAGVTNLFRDGAKKHHSDLPLTGYSPAKKKGGRVAHSVGGGRCTRSDGMSPCNPFDVLNDDALQVRNNNNNDDEGDPNYLPTPKYKRISQVARNPKTRDPKVVLDSSYFAFLRPLMFDTNKFPRGNPQVYSKVEMCKFDANFQKQLAFNFCATRARRKKSATINEAQQVVCALLISVQCPHCFHLTRQITMSCLVMF
jgi:hypothetical protein